ncbi:cation channel sperm-associated protein 2-like [Halichondria panicea]|uniref:cation channel sperm-associated protein 2-like n=1 Tax=Halichondria panicea TaxID=6063 RepID=UPI00312B68A2
MDVKSHTLSHRAEVFRSKLIENFQIIESLSEQGIKKVPVYTSADITNTCILDKVLLENPEQTIKFKTYQRDKIEEVNNVVDRRLIRVKNQNKLPLGVWALWVVENRKFQNMLLILIILNGISIGIEGELPVTNDIGIALLRMLLNFIDSFSVIVFTAEIVLKWMDNFRGFWKNPWNIFDFVVTVVSAVPLIIMLLTNDRTSQFAIVTEQLAVFRIIRALKMIAQFGSLRIIVLTVLKAFKSLVFIGILLFVVTYIFASAGVIFFEAYTMSQRTDLRYPRSFSSLVDATITLFQLFTLDQWYRIYNDLIKVIHPAFACTYILLWVWIGAFLFRNLFVGIMVNNFQNITEELTRKQENMDHNEELARMKEELNTELTMHDSKMTNARRSIFVPKASSSHLAGSSSTVESGGGAELREQISQMMHAEKRISAGWDKTVRSHLMALSCNPVETLWPRETLFRYYQVMELLVENLDEYDKLQKLANDCLVNLHDSKP